MPPLLLAQIPDLRKMFSHKIFIHTTISCNKSRQYSSTHKRFSQSGAHESSRHIHNQQQYIKNDESQTHQCIIWNIQTNPRQCNDYETLQYALPTSTGISPQPIYTNFFHSPHHQAHTYNNIHTITPCYIIITLPEHTSDYDVLKGQRGRDDRPQAVAQHQH